MGFIQCIVELAILYLHLCCSYSLNNYFLNYFMLCSDTKHDVIINNCIDNTQFVIINTFPQIIT